MELTESEKRIKTREKLFHHPWISASYYDHPDGQDLPGKLYFVTKFTSAIGAGVGSLYAINVREKISFQMKCLRFSQVFFPCVGLGAAFTCVVYYSTVLRKKDDELNYFYGGLFTGSLLGLFTGRVSTSVWIGSIGGICGLFIKGCQMHNIPLLGEGPSRVNAPYVYQTWDYTLLPEQKGNWTK